jgi:hypothetical protein
MWLQLELTNIHLVNMRSGKGTSSSRRIRFLSSKITKKGRVDVEKTLGRQGVRDFRAKAQSDLQTKIAGKPWLPLISLWDKLTSSGAMSEVDCDAYNAVREIPEDGDDSYVTDDDAMNINDVLDGTVEVDLSHAGGKFQQLMEDALHQESWYVYSPTT